MAGARTRLSFAAVAASLLLQGQADAPSFEMFTQCQWGFSVLVPAMAKPTERAFSYTTRTGATVPAREYFVQRGTDRLSVTVVDFSNGPVVDDAHVEFAAANLRKLGEVRFQDMAPYDPGMPGRQLNIFRLNNRQLRASIYMAEHKMYITQAEAVVGDFPAMQFEQSLTLVDDKGNDLDRPNGAQAPRNFGCRG